MATETILFNPIKLGKLLPLNKIAKENRGKIYADVPLSYFANLDELKNYAKELADLGVNVLLILPHFLPSFSPYVVKNYEEPCQLFGDWATFTEFMQYVQELGMDRMIDIPLNHCDWQADNIKREWFINHDSKGIEAGADDIDADNNRIRINWGAYVLDNSIKELQRYWLDKVIFPHIEKYNVNAIRIDAAWGLDSEGLKNIVSAVKEKYPNVWFLAENLGMDKLINLAESGINAGADRFFNNMYWHSQGNYIPKDIYKLVKRSNSVPTCTLFSSHDVLMPAMKAYSIIRNSDIVGMNDKAITRQFVQYDNINSLADIPAESCEQIISLMKLDFLLAALMTSDTMFVAGSEKALFKGVNVSYSSPNCFKQGFDSDFTEFMKVVFRIKTSNTIFNCEGAVIAIGSWSKDKLGLKGYVKSIDKQTHLLVATNTNFHEMVSFVLPNRLKRCEKLYIISDQEKRELLQSEFPERIEIQPQQAIILHT